MYLIKRCTYHLVVVVFLADVLQLVHATAVRAPVVLDVLRELHPHSHMRLSGVTSAANHLLRGLDSVSLPVTKHVPCSSQ